MLQMLFPTDVISIVVSADLKLVSTSLCYQNVGVTIVPEYGITPKTTKSDCESQNTI